MEVLMDQTFRNKISFITKYLMIFLMIADVAVMASMPFTLKKILIIFFEPASAENLLIFYYILLYVTGMLVLMILNNLRRLFNLMIIGQPFIRTTEKRLLNIGVESFLISAMLIIKIFVQNSLMTMTSAGVFLVAGLFCLVLSDLFHSAVDYKEENDLTV